MFEETLDNRTSKCIINDSKNYGILHHPDKCKLCNFQFHCALKGPGTLKDLVKLLTSCLFLVLPGLQMNSKADHNPRVHDNTNSC